MNLSKDSVIQICVGLVIVILVYLLSMWIMQRDQILDEEVAYMRPTKLSVDVLNGHANLSNLADKQWNTMNQAATNFLPILKSYNRRGGLQFSYSFWIKIDTRSGGTQLANQSILLHGDRTPYRWHKNTRGNQEIGTPNTSHTYGPTMLVKCPHIRFGRTFDEIIVEFNTLTDPHVAYAITPTSKPGPGERRNALSLMQGKWAMLTFAFEDNVGISNFEEGIMVRTYLNDDLYHTHRQRGAFRRNQGDLFVAPNLDRSINNVMVGDIRYHNYAIQPEEVSRLFRDGPPNRASDEVQQRSDPGPLYLSEYNKLDIYNT